MEESSNKVLFIIVGIVAVLLVISFGFLVVRSSLEKGNGLTNSINDKMDNVLASQYTQYEATEISGSQVLNLISETYSASDSVYITVVTNAGNTTNYVCDATTLVKDAATAHSTKMTNAKAKANAAYITPTGKFLGTVNRNTNEAIVGLTFTQQ